MSNQPNQPRFGPTTGPPGHVGHAHFWERFLSRRQFFRTAAGAAGVVGAGLWLPTPAQAGKEVVLPKPIPGGIQPLGPGTEVFHFAGMAAAGLEPSTITDFNGFIGETHVTGTGTATNTKTQVKTKLFFDGDMRFMKGTYVGVDGKTHHGTFALI
jgi:hypothetical protein